MSEVVAALLGSTDKIFLTVGVAALIVAILAPEQVRRVFGSLKWTLGKQLVLGFAGVALIATGALNPWDREPFEAPVTYYGYHGEVGKDGTTISKEEYELSFAKNSMEVRGEIEGDVSTHGKVIRKIWKFDGYRRDNQMVLTFATQPTTADPNPTGIGTYYLEQTGAREFTGTAIYKDCALRAIVQCPYAMTNDDIDSSTARTRWTKLFDRQCTTVNLVPDLPSTVVATTSPSCSASTN